MQQISITTLQDDPAAISRLNDIMQQAGRAASSFAARVALAGYTARKADNTIRRKRADLVSSERYLRWAGGPASGPCDNLQAQHDT